MQALGQPPSREGARPCEDHEAHSRVPLPPMPTLLISKMELAAALSQWVRQADHWAVVLTGSEASSPQDMLFWPKDELRDRPQGADLGALWQGGRVNGIFRGKEGRGRCLDNSLATDGGLTAPGKGWVPLPVVEGAEEGHSREGMGSARGSRAPRWSPRPRPILPSSIHQGLLLATRPGKTHCPLSILGKQRRIPMGTGKGHVQNCLPPWFLHRHSGSILSLPAAPRHHRAHSGLVARAW